MSLYKELFHSSSKQSTKYFFSLESQDVYYLNLLITYTD